jgi:hypothetical protein
MFNVQQRFSSVEYFVGKICLLVVAVGSEDN